MPDTIVPCSCIVGAITWNIEREVREALVTQPDPGTGPPGRLFVPQSVRPSVLSWAHASRLTCHPGIARTSAFLHRRFWWLSLEADTKSYVSACHVCAQNKGSNLQYTGLLHPLPIPRRPCSHIALDFVTGLPQSEGKTVVLKVVDRFSKFARFLPCPNSLLPRRRQISLSGRYFVSTVCPVTWCQTGIPSLCLRY